MDMCDTGFPDIQIIGKSPAIQKKLDFILKVANSDKSVLIIGETGTGKDLTAKKIHDLSDRKDKPYLTLNCANIPGELFEAELCGYIRGAFTGAFREKMGLLEAARDGTVFMDEIGDLPFYLQAKILRIIDKKEFRRIGETSIRKAAVRFIFATNKDLAEEVKKGRFRKDLYFRISVIKFSIPPLRERREDIPLLVHHVLEKESGKGRDKKEISPSALKKLMAYNFPGNVRELENIIERAFLLSDGCRITEKDIKLEKELACFDVDHEPMAQKIREALESCRWNKTKAASQVGTSRRQFYRLLKKYRMSDCMRKNYFF